MYDFTSIYRASSVPDAIAALEREPRAVVIAGGSDVLIKIREGKLAGVPLVSIHGLDAELAGVSLLENGDLAIGPLTTFRGVTRDPLIQAHVPVLGEAADMAGGLAGGAHLGLVSGRGQGGPGPRRAPVPHRPPPGPL